MLESGNYIAIAEIKVGDRILAFTREMEYRFADVIAVPHQQNQIPSEFLHITTVEGKDLKLTAAHILPVGTCGGKKSLKMASEVRSGDCLVTVDTKDEVIASVTHVNGKGIYTVVTDEEYIVVGGIVASPFAINHHAAQAFYTFHRMLNTWCPGLLSSKILGDAISILALVLGDTLI